MKSFGDFITESSTTRAAKAVESKLRKMGTGYKRKDNINDAVFTLDGGYKIVTDGMNYDIKKGSKVVDSFPNSMGMLDRVISKYEELVGE